MAPINSIRRPKIIILGHGRHGKDSVAEMLQEKAGYKFTSSSRFVGEECIWDNWGCAVYDTFDEMYEDRENHRDLWGQLIAAYNVPDKTRTAKTMFDRGFDLYVGMRRIEELIACRLSDVYDLTVWVDRSEHLPPEPSTSMTIRKSDAMHVIDNNGTLEDLAQNVQDFIRQLGLADV